MHLTLPTIMLIVMVMGMGMALAMMNVLILCTFSEASIRIAIGTVD
jgi:hypothetical protein